MRPALSTLSGKKNLTGAEIGVYTAVHAKEILNDAYVGIKLLYLVDPYIPYTENGKTHNDGIDQLYDKLVVEFKPEKRVKFIRKKSEAASHDIDDASLDFVYIDANHEYENVLIDIKSWMPKLKKGGLMSGHDWGGNEPGVNQAVLEYCKDYSFKLESEGQDWWYEK